METTLCSRKPTSRSLYKFVIENGRFSDLFLFERLPIDLINSDKRMPKEHIETYSSGYCPGFSPDSLSEFPQEIHHHSIGGKSTFF